MNKYTYYTNGTKEARLLSSDVVPDGWYKGRVKPAFRSVGYKWINNGIVEYTIPKDETLPDGFSYGRLRFSYEQVQKQRDTLRAIQYKSYNNGKVEIRVGLSEKVPEGFVLGRLPMSDEQRKRLSLAHTGMHHSEESRHKISAHSNNNREKAKATCIKKYGVPYVMCVAEYRSKANDTRRRNNTFNSSKPEDIFYTELINQYGINNVRRHYKSSEYPFYCDFYIIPTQEYIELNLHWTHGGMPFDSNDPECQRKLTEWREKAKVSKYFANAIETWTIRDVQKVKTAKKNGLNYRIIYQL